MVVDLPAPLGPSRQNSWFSSMVSQEPLSAQKAFGLFSPPEKQQQMPPSGPHGLCGNTFCRPNTSTALRCPTFAASSPGVPAEQEGQGGHRDAEGRGVKVEPGGMSAARTRQALHCFWKASSAADRGEETARYAATTE